MPARRLLVVDDEPNVIRSLTRMLELEGFETLGVTSGAEAIEHYRRDNFDLALVDLEMPDVKGLEVLRAIKEYDPAAKVIIFTAYGTKDNVVDALRLGAAEFLEKPLNIKTLTATVQELLKQDTGQAVQGNLHTLSLPSIIQINCEERNEARLHLRRQGEDASLFFADGNVVHAELGPYVGEEAVYKLLRWETGNFKLEKGVSPPERTINVGWTGLLLEGMRRIDEQAAALDAASSLALYPDDEVDLGLPEQGDERPHCPECGALLDDQGRCYNPDCSHFSGDVVDQHDQHDLEEFTLEEVTEVNEMASIDDLKSILKDMADEMPGFISADVVGMDGLSIAGYSSNPNFDAEAASAQFALVMKLVQKTVAQLGSGAVQDNLVTSDNAYILSRFLGDGSYYLGVAVDKNSGSLGNMRLMTRNYASKLWNTIPR